MTCFPEDSVVKCEKCGSENTVEGKLSTGMGGVFFTGTHPKKPLPFPGSWVPLTAWACKDCGAVFGIRLEDPKSVDK